MINNDQIKSNRNIKRFIPPFMRKRTFAYSMLTVNILFITWVVVTETGLADELFLPGPLKVWQSFIEVSTEGYQGNTLFIHVFTSVNRILAAFILATNVSKYAAVEPPLARKNTGESSTGTPVASAVTNLNSVSPTVI